MGVSDSEISDATPMAERRREDEVIKGYKSRKKQKLDQAPRELNDLHIVLVSRFGNHRSGKSKFPQDSPNNPEQRWRRRPNTCDR